MKIIHTDTWKPSQGTSETEKLWVYNGLDCCVTLEVLDEMLPQLDNYTGAIYNLSRALQAPVLEMNLRGVLVDEAERQRALNLYRGDMETLESNLYTIVRDGVGYTDFKNSGKTRAWRSPDQVATLLYDVLRIPPIRKRNTNGELVRTVNRDALERLQVHFYALPLISHILALRDLGKKVSVLETDIDEDGRFRTSFNIAGTTTGRFSSSLNDFGTGGNLQNVEERLRRIFISDPGKKFANIDLEQADSRNIGAWCWNIFLDSKYLDACESGDLHTTVSRLVWPDLNWTGNLKEDRRIADQLFYRHYSRRYMSKKGGHGTNYLGSAFEIAKQTKTDKELIERFQASYFGAFPAISKLHDWTRETLIKDGYIITPLLRKRWFFGRRDEEDTVKQAIAYMGQSLTADEMNHAMIRVWQLNICEMLLQGHDSLLVQYPEEKEDEVVTQLREAMKVPIELAGGRRFVVPCEVKVGWNWANADPGKENFEDGNPLGLKKWPDDRSRS